LCAQGRSASFGRTGAYDNFRLQKLDEWGVDTVVWFGYWAKYYYYNQNPHDFFKDFEILASKAKKRVIVVGDPVYLTDAFSEKTGLNYFYQRGKEESLGYAFVAELEEDPAKRITRLAVEQQIKDNANDQNAPYYGKVVFVETSSYFQREVRHVDGSTKHYVQLVDPATGKLVMSDNHHVNSLGVQRFRQLFQKEIFDERGFCEL
jgi:hypothetical protein